MSHVTCTCDSYAVQSSRHIWMGHVTYERVTSHVDETRTKYMLRCKITLPSMPNPDEIHIAKLKVQQWVTSYRPCKISCSKNVHLSKVTEVFVGRDYALMVRLLIFSGTRYSQPCFPYSRKCTLSRWWILPARMMRCLCWCIYIYIYKIHITKHDYPAVSANSWRDTYCEARSRTTSHVTCTGDILTILAKYLKNLNQFDRLWFGYMHVA